MVRKHKNFTESKTTYGLVTSDNTFKENIFVYF